MIRFSAMLAAVAGLVGGTVACDGSQRGTSDMSSTASATTPTDATATSNELAEANKSLPASGRACPLPSEWQALFVDVTGDADSPDPAVLRQMSVVGGALFTSDDYRVGIARLVSDDASKPLPAIDENGLLSEDWWDSVDHDVYAMLQERELGEAGVDFCLWILKSQGDFDATQSEVQRRLGQL